MRLKIYSKSFFLGYSFPTAIFNTNICIIKVYTFTFNTFLMHNKCSVFSTSTRVLTLF